MASILCKCGCGQELEEYDKYGRKRQHIHGHQLGGRFRKLDKHFNWKGGEYTDNKGYVQVHSSNHPNAVDGYVRRSRLVMEKHIGRYLESDELVIHINNDNKDDRIENLKLTTRQEFTRQMHMKDMGDRVCAICSSSVTTKQHKSDRPMWYRYENGVSFMCAYCYQHRRMHVNHRRYRMYESNMLKNNLDAMGSKF